MKKGFAREDMGKEHKDLEKYFEVYLYRKISNPITKWLAKNTGITPNQATIYGLVFAVFAGLLFLTNNYWCLVLGGIAAYVSNMWDTLDGNLASIKNIESYSGAWLDGNLDRISEFAIISGAGIGIYLINPSLLIIVVTLLAIFPHFFIHHLNYSMISYFPVETDTSRDMAFRTPSRKTEMKLIDFFTYGRAMFNTIVMVGAFVNQLFWVLVFFAVFVNLYAFVGATSIWKRFKNAEKLGYGKRNTRKRLK